MLHGGRSEKMDCSDDRGTSSEGDTYEVQRLEEFEYQRSPPYALTRILVKWTGFDSSCNTWEPLENLNNSIFAYEWSETATKNHKDNAELKESLRKSKSKSQGDRLRRKKPGTPTTSGAISGTNAGFAPLSAQRSPEHPTQSNDPASQLVDAEHPTPLPTSSTTMMDIDPESTAPAPDQLNPTAQNTSELEKSNEAEGALSPNKRARPDEPSDNPTPLEFPKFPEFPDFPKLPEAKQDSRDPPSMQDRKRHKGASTSAEEHQGKHGNETMQKKEGRKTRSQHLYRQDTDIKQVSDWNVLQGDEAYRQGDYQAALSKYCKAVRILEKWDITAIAQVECRKLCCMMQVGAYKMVEEKLSEKKYWANFKEQRWMQMKARWHQYRTDDDLYQMMKDARKLQWELLLPVKPLAPYNNVPGNSELLDIEKSLKKAFELKKKAESLAGKGMNRDAIQTYIEAIRHEEEGDGYAPPKFLAQLHADLAVLHEKEGTLCSALLHMCRAQALHPRKTKYRNLVSVLTKAVKMSEAAQQHFLSMIESVNEADKNHFLKMRLGENPGLADMPFRRPTKNSEMCRMPNVQDRYQVIMGLTFSKIAPKYHSRMQKCMGSNDLGNIPQVNQEVHRSKRKLSHSGSCKRMRTSPSMDS